MELITKEKTYNKHTDIEEYQKIAPFVILEGYRGSQAHGTYCPEHPDHIDDVDLISITIPPLDYYVGLKEPKTQEIKHGKWDIVNYDIRNYIRFLLKQNPNLMTMLWLHETHYTKLTKWGQILIDNRKAFVSKESYQHFVGYARGQFHRMEHFDTGKSFQGYMGAKRKNNVEKYGYDCKNAAHLIRLLKMGIELLTTGELVVLRPDNQMLIDIKFGGWPLDKVKAEAERLFILAEEAFIRSTIPLKPDYILANELCKELILDFHKTKASENE